MPFARTTVAPWLKVFSGNPAEEEDNIRYDIWTKFLISRDLSCGLSFSPNNNKNRVKFYNATQFTRQFVLTLPCMLTKNKSLENKVVRSASSVQKAIITHFEKLLASFELVKFDENPAATSVFETWWDKYITKQTSSSIVGILSLISPDHISFGKALVQQASNSEGCRSKRQKGQAKASPTPFAQSPIKKRKGV